jgi:hypothetical protein
VKSLLKKMLHSQTLIKSLLGLALLLSLYPVFSASYFVTADGPCHVHGAVIFTDLLLNGKASHFATYAQLNPAITNWGSVVVLSLLQVIFSPNVAEKIFVMLLITSFVIGLAKCLKQISGSWQWPVVAIPFIASNILLQYGFYNFYMGIAIGWWLVYYFIKSSAKHRVLNTLYGSVLGIVVFLCHPLSFLFTSLYVFVFSALHYFKKSVGFNSPIKILKRLFVLLLPACLLLAVYLIQHKHIMHIANERSMSLLWRHLYKGESFTLFGSSEQIFVQIILASLVIIAIAGIVKRSIPARSAMLLLLLICSTTAAYFFLPNELFGGGLFSIRMQWLAYIFLFMLGYFSDATQALKAIAAFFMIACLVPLNSYRASTLNKCSKVVEQAIKSTEDVPKNKNLAYLKFAYNCLDRQWNPISENQFLLSHTVCYVGAIKHNIVPDNILLSTDYYPVNWKNTCDVEKAPLLLKKGIQAIPPTIDINLLKQNLAIDYIVTYAATADTFTDPIATQTWQQVLNGFEKVNHSEGGVWRLYKKN